MDKEKLEDTYLDEDYFLEYPEEIPEGCRQCGGPYPKCVTSCGVWDDD